MVVFVVILLGKERCSGQINNVTVTKEVNKECPIVEEVEEVYDNHSYSYFFFHGNIPSVWLYLLNELCT